MHVTNLTALQQSYKTFGGQLLAVHNKMKSFFTY